MSLEHRDYMRDDHPSSRRSGGPAYNFTAGWIVIGLNLAILIAYHSHGGPEVLLPLMELSREAIQSGRVWVVLTCSFFHYDLVHAISALFMVWLVGREIEHEFGKSGFLGLYVLGGFVAALGALLYPGSWFSGGLLSGADEHLPDHFLSFLMNNPMVFGASASALAMSAAVLSLDHRRTLFTGRDLEVPLWVIVVIYAALESIGVWRETLFQPVPPWPRWYLALPVLLGLYYAHIWKHAPKPTPNTRRVQRVTPSIPAAPPSSRVDPETARKVDALLERISTSGLESLSEDERAFLNEASSKYKR